MFERLFRRSRKPKSGADDGQRVYSSLHAPISPSLSENKRLLQSILGNSADITFREIRTGVGGVKALLAYVEGIVDITAVVDSVVKPLTLLSQDALSSSGGRIRHQLAFETIRDMAVASAQVSEHEGEIGNVVEKMLEGDSALFVEGFHKALTVSTKGWKDRAVEEPETELVVRGPREGFTETLRTNTALIRRRVRDPNLRIERISLGTRTKTDTVLVYIRGIANDSLVREVRRRLSRIRIDSVLDSGYIEELIEDNPGCVFPSVQHTERPDRVVGALMEGRVAIVTDGSPAVLVVPAGLPDFLTTNEDYYERFVLAALTRPIRYLAFAISLLLPGFYVAATTFHQEMIPTRLLVTIAQAREGIPFPAAVEALIMELTFEILREAGIRMPRAVGQAVSIVGAVVVGEAAVRAGIVSAPMVIVVALTGISSFAVPSYKFGIGARWLRFPILLLAGTLGLFGVVIGTMMVLIKLASLRSFGQPYLYPIAPFSLGGMKDTLFRAPQWALRYRPSLLSQENRKRQSASLQPRPPEHECQWQERRGQGGDSG